MSESLPIKIEDLVAGGPRKVMAVKVLNTNLVAAAQWCGGITKDVTPLDAPDRVVCILVPAIGKKGEIREPFEAYPGDWIVLDRGRFEVYTPEDASLEFRAIPTDDTGFVPKDYVVDQATEKVLRGSQLQNGMMVLILSSNVREDLQSRYGSPHIVDRARVTNRWCEVTDLRIDRSKPNPLLMFIGVYNDGSVASRQYSLAYDWIVKLSSMREHPRTTSPACRKDVILKLVRTAMEDAGCRCYEEADDEIARLTTDKIVKLFE